MAKDATKLLYAGDGEVYTAPVGTAMPTDVTAALNVAFVGLGYMAEDGVTIASDITTNETPAWQALGPIDERVVALQYTIQGGILQFNQESFKILFGGGEWAGTTLVTYSSPTGATPFYRAIVVETIDATKKTRYCFPRCSVTDTGELQLRRPEAANAAVTFRALTTDSGSAMTVISDVVSLLT